MRQIPAPLIEIAMQNRLCLGTQTNPDGYRYLFVKDSQGNRTFICSMTCSRWRMKRLFNRYLKGVSHD